MMRATMFAVVLGLALVPSGLEAQQASIQASVRIVNTVETQRLVAEQTAGSDVMGGGQGVPQSWRWEIHAAARNEAGAGWASSQPIAAGRGGDPATPLRYAMEGEGVELAYLFAPI